MDFLESKGSEQTRKIYKNHGLTGDHFGVKVGDMKIIQKKVKTDHELAKKLFNTLNGDAQYLAGLIADPNSFTPDDLKKWSEDSTWNMVNEYAVAWNLADREDCIAIAKEWLNDSSYKVRACAWSSLASHLGVASNDTIDQNEIKALLNKVKDSIHEAKNREQYCMNSFVIAAGGAFPELTDFCIELGKEIGKVEVYMGKTSCKVPYSPDYIKKMKDKGRIGKKKKTAKC